MTTRWGDEEPTTEHALRLFQKKNLSAAKTDQEQLFHEKAKLNRSTTEISERIVKFRYEFKDWCRWRLTDDLTDKLAWDYTSSALSKVGLAKDYQDLIKELPLDKRTWKQVVVCLNKALKTELLEAHLADEVVTARPMPGETFLAFTQRITPLIEAAKFPDDGCNVVIKGIGNHLSDIGFHTTIKEYGSFDEIQSIKNYLDFLTKTPGVLEGSKTDRTLYFL
ncbi:hypothetical protein BGZ94_002824 [Podila epigama]|nr:hypothetical protein BGZ94_002824 [Podila epigama]